VAPWLERHGEAGFQYSRRMKKRATRSRVTKEKKKLGASELKEGGKVTRKIGTQSERVQRVGGGKNTRKTHKETTSQEGREVIITVT